MKRRFAFLIISITSGLIIIITGLLIWLMGTNEGARWLLDKAIRRLPVTVTTGRIEGTLASGLTLEGVHVELAESKIDIEKAAFAWNLLYLTGGHLAIYDARLLNVTLFDKNPANKTPWNMTWPRLPRFALWCSAGINDFQINNFIYRNSAGEVFRADAFQARIGWHYGSLTLKDINLQSAQGKIGGVIEAGFARPAVSGDIRFLPRKMIINHDRFDLKIKSGKTKTGEQVALDIDAAAYFKNKEHLKLSGSIGVKPAGFVLHELRLLEQGRPGQVAVKGEVSIAGDSPLFDLQIRAIDLELLKDTEVQDIDESRTDRKKAGPSLRATLTNLQHKLAQGRDAQKIVKKETAPVSYFKRSSLIISGSIVLKGNMQNYTGNIQVKETTSTLPWLSGQIKGRLAGNAEAARLTNIEGSFLGGGISGSLGWMWQGKNQLSFTLQGRSLDPATIDQRWNGNVNMDSRGAFTWSESAPLQGTFSVNLIKSIFDRKDLSGNIEARYEQGTISFVQGYLRGNDFRLAVKGTPASRLDCQINVADLSSFFSGIDGQIQAEGWVRWKKGETAGLLKGSGVFPIDTATTIRTSRMELQWEWNGNGLAAKWNTELASGGHVEGNFSSPESIKFALPEAGLFAVSWQAIDPELLRHWYDKSIRIQGRLNGKLQGTLLPGGQLKAAANIILIDGRLSREAERGVFTSAIKRATSHVIWEDESLKGNIVLDLTDYGQLNGDFQLPLTARLPLRIATDGPVRIQVQGSFREKGMLSAIFPGSVSESHGKIKFQITAGGTWQKPDFRGKATLEEAGIYFPQIGIRMEGAGAQAEWVEDQISIRSFHVRSGNSDLQGSATIWLAGWTLSRYEGKIAGENVQAVYLPEIRLRASPDLQFSGDQNKMLLRGTIRIPEALIRYSEKEGVISASRDVVIADLAAKKKTTSAPFILDTNVTVILGDKFQLDAEGLHAGLGGQVALKGTGLDKILLSGQIATVKGYYEHYGVKLDIVRGRTVFRDEPADLGNLDILALKKIHDTQKGIDVEAGVTITGNLRSPLVKLYGRPAMSDRDVISYMVIGQPYSENTGSSQKEQMAQWAAAILAGSPSSSLPRRLKALLGIDTVGVVTGSTGTMTSSLLTIGKYLSPDLYVAFGRSLFGNDYYISARYSFLKHWQIESNVGPRSATDIFYRIEFD